MKLLPHPSSSNRRFCSIAQSAFHFVKAVLVLIRCAALRAAGDFAQRLRARFMVEHFRFKIGKRLILRPALVAASGGTERWRVRLIHLALIGELGPGAPA